MTYAVLDMDRETLSYARVGHTPLIYMRGNGGQTPEDVLTPNSLLVGLDGFQSHFEHLVEKASLHVGRGNIVSSSRTGSRRP